MPGQGPKKLSDLRVVDLKLQERRGLDKNVSQRLRRSLQHDGVDPDNYSFGVADPKKRKSYYWRKSPDESHHIELSDRSEAESESEISNEDSESCEEIFIEISDDEEPSKADCQTVPPKPTTNKSLMSKKLEPEKVKCIQKNTVSKSSIEDSVEDESIDLVVVEDDEDQLHLSFDDEILHDKKTSTPVSVAKSIDNILKAGNGKNKTRDLNNTPSTTLVEKVQDTPSNRKTAITTQKKSANKTSPKVVWVSNVSHNTSASELQDALSAHGNVIGAKVVVSARYPGSSCYGYVTMASNEDVDNVIAKLNNTELNGQIIKLGRKLNDQIRGPTRTRSEDVSKIQGKKTASERGGLQRNRSIDRSRSMEKGRSRDGSYSNERFKGRRSRSPCRKSGVLTFAQIKEERERQKLREQERALREASRRRQEEIDRQKDIDRRQRQEAMRLEREKEKLRLEKEKIAREREELMKLERERYKIAQEKIELEKTLSRLEEGGIKRPAPHPVNDRKRFATGNRPFEGAPPPRFDYSARSKNNCGNYDGPSQSSSSKYDRKPYNRHDRTAHHRPKQNFGNSKQRKNDVPNVNDPKRNNDLHYDKMKSRLSDSSKSFHPSDRPNRPATFSKSDWRPIPVQNDRRVSGDSNQLHPYSNMSSNLNSQYAPPARTANYFSEKRFDNAKSVGSSNRKFQKN